LYNETNPQAQMNFIQLDISPYSFNAAALAIIAGVFILYLLQHRNKPPYAFLLMLGMSGLTLGMISLLASSVVLWGAVNIPLTDACAMFSMAAVTAFLYNYPEKVRSFCAYLVQAFTITASVLAVIVCGWFAVRILFFHAYDSVIPSFYWFINPLVFLTTLLVAGKRTWDVHRKSVAQKSSAQATLFQALRKPCGRQTRLLRNYTVALALGLIQGIASGLNMIGLLDSLLAIFLVNLSLLGMVIAIVYASFELLPIQPGLIVRLVGLTLVNLLAILGVTGMFTTRNTTDWVIENNRETVSAIRQAIRDNQPGLPPVQVVYITRQGMANAAIPAQMLHGADTTLDADALLEEINASPTAPVSAPPIWNYFLESQLRSSSKYEPAVFRYGSHPNGSYYQYAAYIFNEAGSRYEVGFDLAKMSLPIQNQSHGLLWTVLISAFFIVLIFPWFFTSSLIDPLERLLSGVRQADAGDLEVVVPVTHNDEVGFLTDSFNRLTASLKDELSRREIAEANLLEVNRTLEQRVANRTRELEALYDVSAAASQAYELQGLLSTSLERMLAALNSSGGMIFLMEEAGGADLQFAPRLFMVASQGLPLNWDAQIDALITDNRLIDAILQNGEPVLIPDTHSDSRLRAFPSETEPYTLILAPLQAEGMVLGLLGLMRDARIGFQLDEVALLTSIAGQVGMAVHTEHLRQRAQIATVLEERQRLTRDLHDSVIQSLYGLVTLTEAGRIRVETGDLKAIAHTFTRIGQTARQAIREIRLFIHQMRSPLLQQEGLVGALDLRLAAVEGRSDVHVTFTADEELNLSPPVETALYAIAQEALNNTLKHARADAVNVSLTQNSTEVVLEIQDNGCGFDPLTIRQTGMGLLSMRERAAAIDGHLEVHSHPDEGTLVRICVKEDCRK
jgi:signal transduction histidine kinase